MTTIKEKLSRGINPPNMLQSMASGYRRAALEEIERLEKVIDELRGENARLALIVADYEMADYKGEVAELKARLEKIEKKYPKSFAEAHPANPNATCKCEHWQSCPDCHPTAHSDKYNPAPVYTSNCVRHPDAPHGVDVDASWRAGKSICVCQSWAPGEAS